MMSLQGSLSIERMCQLAAVSRASFYRSLGKREPALAAAQLLERAGYGIEIEPKYVAVALERLSDMGLKPKLVSSVLTPRKTPKHNAKRKESSAALEGRRTESESNRSPQEDTHEVKFGALHKVVHVPAAEFVHQRAQQARFGLAELVHQPQKALLKCPRWLNKFAREEWTDVVPELWNGPSSPVFLRRH